MDSATNSTTGTGIVVGTGSDQQQWNCAAGNEVFGCDEHKVGKVKEVHPGYLVVSQGLITHTTLYVPTSAINNCEEGRVYLNVTKDEASHRGWNTPPASTTTIS